MNVSVDTSLATFNRALVEYAKLKRDEPADVLAKQGTKLTFYLRASLAALKPEKGRTRAERLAALQAGQGIKVRPGALAWAKKRSMATATNLRTRQESLFVERTRAGNVKRNGRSFWQLAIYRELGIRESGRGYLSLAGRMRWVKEALIRGSEYRVVDRVYREVGRAGLKVNTDGATLKLDYSNPNIAEGLERPNGKKAVAKALDQTRADIMVYVRRKLDENARKAGLK